METHHCELEENGVKLALTVIDTPGYGDAVDNTNCWNPILEYIEDQFDDFLEAETRVTRVEVGKKNLKRSKSSFNLFFHFRFRTLVCMLASTSSLPLATD